MHEIPDCRLEVAEIPNIMSSADVIMPVARMRSFNGVTLSMLCKSLYYLLP